MTRKILALFFIILLNAIHSHAIELDGNTHISQNELLTGISGTISDDSLIAHIKYLYQQAGYFGVRVSPVDLNKKGEKTIKIVEGHRANIDKIEIELLPANNKIQLSEIAAELKGQAASQENLDYFASECIDYLAENGMPYAGGSWSDFSFSPEGNLLAQFRIVTGPIIYISRIKYRGLKRTRPGVLDRQFRLKPGVWFCQSQIKEAQTVLDNMPYLEIAAPFTIEPTVAEDSCNIVFNLKENPSTRFDGVAGLSSTGGKSSFVGKLDLELGDILGTGRAFGFNWNRKDRRSNELRVSYLEPFLLKSGFDLSLSAYQIDRDTLYITYGGSVGLSHKFTTGLLGSLTFTIARTVPEDSSIVIASTSRMVSAKFQYDHTDLRENPRDGYDIVSTLDYKYRSNRFDSLLAAPLPTKLTSVGFEIHNYSSITEYLVAAIRLSYWGIVANDGEPPPDELAYIGGFDNLRGYTEKRFPAERYGLVSLEPRIITGKYSRTYLFGDLAIIDSGPMGENHHEYGYGLGLAAPSMLGQFKLEIAWGKNGFPSEAIFNFGLAGKF
jgi:outer membrane protein assembly factor BamA